MSPEQKCSENSNRRPRVCTGNACRPRVLSPTSSWLVNLLTQDRGIIPLSEPVTHYAVHQMALGIPARPTPCIARTGQRQGEGGTRERPARGAGIGGETRFRGRDRVRQSLARSASREAPEAGKRLLPAGGAEQIVESAILPRISARLGVVHGAGAGEGGLPATGSSAGRSGGISRRAGDSSLRRRDEERGPLAESAVGRDGRRRRLTRDSTPG